MATTARAHINKQYRELKKKLALINKNTNDFNDIESEFGSTKDETLLKVLSNFFYKKKEHYEPFINIVTEDNSKISRRVLDWFVTNYAKKNDITYELKDGDEKISFQIYLEYKAQLKAYGKQKFDPFCRHQRIKFKYDHKRKIVTTLGQLNFFMWAIKNKIIKYVEKNYDAIAEDMKVSSKKNKLSSESSETSSTRRKRHELSVSAIKQIHRDDMSVIIKFDQI